MKTWRVVVIAALLALAGAVLGGMVVWYLVDLRHNSSTSRSSVKDKPNFVIMMADDTGYADFQTFGHPSQEWTGVDRMVKEGMKFTSMYTSVSICSPSRAALLTGRYPIRSGVFGDKWVFAPGSTGGLPKREVTIAEALRDGGYATGMTGKWHLGLNEHNDTDGTHLPMHHGFDYVGTILPVSQMWQCNPKLYTVSDMKWCFVYEKDKISEQPINLQTLTSRLVRDAKDFITKNKDRPFFLYLPFPQTHAALFASPKFEGSSRRGPYGDNVNEMGWAVDEVLNHLEELEIEKDTLVVFTSDNGPIRDGCGEGGSMGPFHGGKQTTWEGGVRVPGVAWWPESIQPETVSHSVVNTMDLYPTLLRLAGMSNYTVEKNILIDGKSIEGILKRETEESPHKALFYYCSELLTAVRYKRYKIHYYTTHADAQGMVDEGREICIWPRVLEEFAATNCRSLSTRHDPPLIFDVEADPEEYISLNPNTTENQHLLETVSDLVQSHQETIVPVQSEIDKPFIDELSPCCNRPACVCNYEGSVLPRPK